MKTDTWSSLKCTKHLINRCTILFSDQWSLRSNYEITECMEGPIKVLWRREVPHNSNHYDTCECCHFGRHGIPCQHIYIVFSSFDDYDEPSHHDVSVWYWRTCLFYPP